MAPPLPRPRDRSRRPTRQPVAGTVAWCLPFRAAVRAQAQAPVDRSAVASAIPGTESGAGGSREPREKLRVKPFPHHYFALGPQCLGALRLQTLSTNAT